MRSQLKETIISATVLYQFNPSNLAGTPLVASSQKLRIITNWLVCNGWK